MNRDATNGDKPVALVIDDSDVDREVMLELLRAGGFEAHGLPSPIGATKTARDRGARVVIVDQNLPAMDGSKLTGLFRSSKGLSGIRVVLVSGNDEAQMLRVASEANADAFVGKSRIHQELVDTAKRLLGY